MKEILLAFAFLPSLLLVSAVAQESLAVLPFQGIGVEASDQETVYILLLRGIKRWDKFELVPASEINQSLDGRICSELACAIEVGRQLDAKKVVFGSLNKLGQKIIVDYTLAEVSSGKRILSDEASALYIEDLDQVVKRIAVSIVQQKAFAKTVEVEQVTAQESQEPGTRKAQVNGGIAFGYLYPQDGYDGKDRIFAWDFKTIYEIRDFAVTGLIGIRSGLALNLGGMYLFSRRDFSPYVGGGLGFHLVSHQSGFGPNFDDKREDGIEIILSGGLMAFRTYNFRVLFNLDYSITFNDYDDRAVVFTIGIIRTGKRFFGF